MFFLRNNHINKNVNLENSTTASFWKRQLWHWHQYQHQHQHQHRHQHRHRHNYGPYPRTPFLVSPSLLSFSRWLRKPRLCQSLISLRFTCLHSVWYFGLKMFTIETFIRLSAHIPIPWIACILPYQVRVQVQPFSYDNMFAEDLTN